MNTRLYNARILSMNNSCEVVEGEVWVEGNRITYVGAAKPSEVPWDREIDVKKNLVMPGFKNAHTHSPMTFLRSYADDLPLLDWLENQVFPMEDKLEPEHIGWFSKLAIMEYLTSGITSNFDMYFHPEMLSQASVDCGFRTVIISGLSDRASSLDNMEEEYKFYNNYNDLIGYRLGFHAEYTTGKVLMEGLAALAEKYKAPVFTHNSETRAEVAGCLERWGKTPTAFMDSVGLFRHGGGGYHCVHLTEEDMEIFRERGLFAVTNPGSNTKLASGIAPVEEMMKRGIKMAIGTDGPASNNCLDMFREMFLVTGLAKLCSGDASSVSADEVLKMAVCGGAYAMGIPDCDCLAPGKLADLIIIDLYQPNMRPINNLTKNLVYSGSKQNVRLTMVNGKVLYEDGAFYLKESADEIYRKVDESLNIIKNK